jgi:hypothetical protein
VIDEVPRDAIAAAGAALVAFIVAWLRTRRTNPSEPNLAVRIYGTLLRSAGIGTENEGQSEPRRYSRREAFLATWFLVFFVLFMLAVFVIPVGTKISLIEAAV